MVSTYAQTNSIRESLERLRPNVHSCLIYETPEEQLAAAVPLLEVGLQRGESCIYVSDQTSIGEVLEAMRERGTDTSAAIQSGALTVIPAPATPGSGGTATALALLAAAGRAANGAGVRLVRQITCEAGQLVDQKQIDEYERQVASCFTGKKYVDVALYHRQSVPPQVLLNVIRSRPVVIWDGTVCNNLHAARPDERLAPDPTAQEVMRVLANLRDRQRIEDGLRAQCRNAAILPVESLLSGAPAHSPASGCGTCLSQISKLHEQLLQTEKMEALGRMASGMMHELETSLATILMGSELLINRLGPDDSRLHLAKRVFTAGRNATRLTNQLLAFGRPSRMRPELLDLNAAVAELEGVLRCELDEQSELRFVPAPADCPVNVDRGQLEQVLLNLVLNARDAMPHGGIVTIRIAQTFQDLHGKVRPGSRAEPVVSLSVTDTGRGMDANTQKRVFDPFFTTKGPGQGTGLGQGAGLGLSIVYGIVQKQFGGSISVESRPGVGTTVTTHFPPAAMAMAAEAQV
jgi:signal transduction histidine kinase